MAGGWYLWTDGGVGGWGLVARACWWEHVRCLWRPCGCCSAVLGGRCVDVVGVPCWYVTG